MLRTWFLRSERIDWPAVELPRLIELLRRAAEEAGEGAAGQRGIRMRLDIMLRALDVEAPPEALWEAATRGRVPVKPAAAAVEEALRARLDADGWKRLHLLVESLREPAVGELLRQRCVEAGAGPVAACLLAGFAAWARPLTPDALVAAPHRLEEFARKWVSALGGRIRGETEAASQKRLRETDPDGLLDGRGRRVGR